MSDGRAAFPPPEMRELPDRTYAPDTLARKRLFVPEAMSFPAKCSLGLVRDLILRYLPRDRAVTVLDPFAGSGSTLLAALYGHAVVLVELEEKFCRMAAASYRGLCQRQLPGLPLGRSWIVRADSRRLPLVTADAVLTSPRYVDSAHKPGNLEAMRSKMAELWPGHVGPNSLRNATEYSERSDNIGNLPRGDVAAVLSSPPYVDARGDWPTPAGAENIRYGLSPGQIGGLAHRDVDAVVSSPPYGNTFSDWDATSKDLQQTGAGYSDERFRPDKQNIGNIPYYDDALDTKRSPKAPEGKETYAEACLSVYRECYRCVRVGGLLVLVVGNYIRDGKEVPLDEDTIKLAIAAGWTPIERWRARKTQVSFWRILHERQGRRKGRDVPLIDCEHVLVFADGAPAWDFADLPPTSRRPFRWRTMETRDGSAGEQVRLTLIEGPAAPR